MTRTIELGFGVGDGGADAIVNDDVAGRAVARRYIGAKRLVWRPFGGDGARGIALPPGAPTGADGDGLPWAILVEAATRGPA